MTSTLALGGVLACGGRQAIVPADAGEESGATQVLGPLDPSPCDASQAFEFKPIATFDNGAGNGGLITNLAMFVSYDGTGNLYPLLATCGFATGVRCDERAEQATFYPNLCSNCVPPPVTGAVTDGGGPEDGGDSGPVGCSSCSCTSGFNPTLGEFPPIVRCGTDSNALHLRASADGGSGLTKWGMNVGLDFRQNTGCNMNTNPDAGSAANPCFFDATGWTGVSFWALLSPGGAATAAALAAVADLNTSSQLGASGADPALSYPYNTLVCGDPPCTTGVGTGGGSSRLQCDPFGKAVGLVDHWEFYTLPFSEMRQKGYGVPQTALDLTHILGFKFNLGKGAWDVWLDDIAFYRPKNP